MEKVKKELKRVIQENKEWLESTHQKLMYGENKLSLKELEVKFPETKTKIQKAQQCLDIIGDVHAIMSEGVKPIYTNPTE